MNLSDEVGQLQLPLQEPLWLTKLIPDGHYGVPLTATSPGGIGLPDFKLIAAEIFSRLGPESSWPNSTEADEVVYDREPPCAAAAMHGVNSQGKLQQVAA